tara:strand:+ start:6758 stop:6973 length:216 start_codon:yes stop_codon:yes gene_type:complete
MGFLKPKVIMPPPLPEIKPLPDAPKMDDPDVVEAGEAEVAKTKGKGRKSTILTSNQGLLEDAETYKPTLLS